MPIDRALFAQECIRQGVFFNIEPHYLVGIAQLRSGISDDSHGDRIGPYQLTQAEWDANSNDDEFELHFTSLQINSPTRQCAVFGLMTQRAFDEFHSANGRNPSAKELYLKQWPDAATNGLQKALDDTADLIGPAADAVLDEPESVTTITVPDQETSGPAPKFGPDPVPIVPVGPDAAGAMLTLALLKKRWPGADASLIAGMAANAGVLSRLGINTPLRMAHFMGQISQECGRGTETVESLNYSAARMMKIFPKRFPDLASTRGFVNNELAFGNKVYNGRMGNRPATNDGFNFRGRGGLQLTGRDSYDSIGKSCGLNLVNNPDLAAAPANFLLIAATEFVKLGCLAECDRDDVVQVSARINLGHPTTSPNKINGLDERRKQLKIWKQEFGVD
jgi:putative chitinase